MRKIKTLLALVLAAIMTAGAVPCKAEMTLGTDPAKMQIHPDVPAVTVQVSDTGKRRPGEDRDLVLQVQITAADNSFSQTLEWFSMEDPAFEQVAGMAKLEDMNFDGYGDLLLLTAAGARNVFYALSLWDVEQGRFRPVEQNSLYDRETKTRTGSTQLELCNHVLYPEQRSILSDVADGYAYRTMYLYTLEGNYGLDLRYIYDVYRPKENTVAETLVHYATQYELCWDEQYAENWYLGGQGEVISERRAAALEVMVGKAHTDADWMEVTNVDWVHLRKENSTESDSLAKLNRGTEVVRLGEENGWVRVWIPSGNQEEKGQTGYIWHRYLKAVPSQPYTATITAENGGKVHLRSGPSRESDSLGLFFAGTPVTCTGLISDEWVPVQIGSQKGYMMSKFLTVDAKKISADQPVTKGYIHTNSTVNFRQEPSKNSQVLAKLIQDEPVTVWGETSDHWYFVTCWGMSGYVMAEFVHLKEDPETVKAAPVELLDVAKGREKFRYVVPWYGGAEKDVTLSEMENEMDSVPLTTTRYTAADVDQDGVKEIVLEQVTPDGYAYCYLVLKSADGKVWGYEIPMRGMKYLKADGTFSFSSGAADNGFGYLQLKGNECDYIEAAESISGGDSITYQVFSVIAKEAAYDAAMETQWIKPEAVWMDLTEEN